MVRWRRLLRCEPGTLRRDDSGDREWELDRERCFRFPRRWRGGLLEGLPLASRLVM